MYGLWGETIKGVQSSEDRHNNYPGQLLRLYRSRLIPFLGQTPFQAQPLFSVPLSQRKKKFEKKPPTYAETITAPASYNYTKYEYVIRYVVCNPRIMVLLQHANRPRHANWSPQLVPYY
jgi:hypothetical protein